MYSAKVKKVLFNCKMEKDKILVGKSENRLDCKMGRK